MGLFGGSSPVCPRNCSKWARVVMKYCLCNVKDGASLTLGMISVLSWGVAEVPQIITTYKEKSTVGLSLAFLVTWIIGDFFNLFGCLLEPATLPTQYYMATLYTATTAVLTGQTIYYSHIYHRLKANKIGTLSHHKDDEAAKSQKSENFMGEKRRQFKADGSQVNEPTTANENHQPSLPIPVGSPLAPRYGSTGRDLYYMSARSLSRSHTPTAGSYLGCSHETRRTLASSLEEPLLGAFHSAPPSNNKSMLCIVSGMIFFLRCFDVSPTADLRRPEKGTVIYLGRKLLQSNVVASLTQEGHTSSAIGTYLGWAMAGIYMGGRLPQICLNIKRGNVEGLNPFMFIFALVGNTTYVASILVNSLEWSKIRPNLPWLVDAGGCVILDCFILLQFAYFCYVKPKNSEGRRSNQQV
ncbi:vacuolar lysine transporter YPQ1 [Aristolochia californica]|uniref:vacuolar lysine transporter YPQ1 n=1 Tax=Aristolochia californica TaxID=171875 RepID=UPI0035DFB13B